ncbi:hypothetical protein RFI_29794 [Reticulomyxa filosa]|uniref:Uncharacterized protein n=1 Tax=Reticulomyxa filosa TaxID=46433 RepID=X6M086_RETFI|nr:hypothetical protein RFI_29794 [Reticulomyxa filosa]|eukprot:ETO07598.1 hypothetical protein RFI_29794 [Reticulomyxa filosa]
MFWLVGGNVNEMPMKWHQTQLNKILMYLLKNGPKHKNRDIRYLCAQAIQRFLSLELNFKQVDNAFNYLLNGLTDVAKGVQSVCVETLGITLTKWNKMQLNITFQCLLSRFNNKSEDILVRMSCAESLGRIAIRMDSMQLDCTLKCLKNGLSDDENAFVRKYCIDALEKLWTKLKQNRTNTQIYAISEAILMKHKEKNVNESIEQKCDCIRDIDKEICSNCAELLEKFAMKLNEKQLTNALNV